MTSRRLVLLVEPGDQRELARFLEGAVSLARRLDARLEAILIDDERLQRACRYPFARETGLTSAVSCAFDASELDSQLRALQARVESMLVSATRSQPLAWSVQLVRGRVSEVLDQGSDPEDWLALAGLESQHLRQLLQPRTKRVLIVRNPSPAARQPTAVTAVLTLDGLNAEAIANARETAKALEAPGRLAFFLPAGHAHPSLETGDAVYELSGLWKPAHLLERMRRAGAEALIAIPGAACPDERMDALEALVRTADFPALILMPTPASK